MINKKLENSIRGLINLYTVVIGAALSLAVASLVSETKGLNSLTAANILLFVAFVATLFPFFHGALRHLDDAYIENNNPNIKKGALIFDFFLLFLHALTFLVLALLLNQPGQFAWLLVGLLSIDIVWGVFVVYGASTSTTLSPEARWAIINTIFVFLASFYLVSGDIYFASPANPIKLSLLITIACLARSIADYIWCREIYFPS